MKKKMKYYKSNNQKILASKKLSRILIGAHVSYALPAFSAAHSNICIGKLVILAGW